MPLGNRVAKMGEGYMAAQQHKYRTIRSRDPLKQFNSVRNEE